MKLKIYDKGKERYMKVGFWSFMKCSFLTQLVLTGIVYGIMLIFWIIFFVIVLMPGGM